MLKNRGFLTAMFSTDHCAEADLIDEINKEGYDVNAQDWIGKLLLISM